MAKCILHPARESTVTIFGKNYCAICQEKMVAASGRVSRHVEPKECFIWYVANDNWQPISGTGCAHWVAHQLDIHEGHAVDRCLAGFTYRVPVLVHSRKLVASVAEVKVNDIWASPSLDHTGLVIRIVPANKTGGVPTLSITHKFCADAKAEFNVGETSKSTPHHDIARWRIATACKITAELRNFD